LTNCFSDVGGFLLVYIGDVGHWGEKRLEEIEQTETRVSGPRPTRVPDITYTRGNLELREFNWGGHTVRRKRGLKKINVGGLTNWEVMEVWGSCVADSCTGRDARVIKVTRRGKEGAGDGRSHSPRRFAHPEKRPMVI